MTDSKNPTIAERVAPAVTPASAPLAATDVRAPMHVRSTDVKQPATRKRATRSTDDAIRDACDSIVARHASVSDAGTITHLPWVDALRTMRWTTGQGCDYKRFRPIFAAACAAYDDAIATLAAAAAAPKRARKSA